MSTDLEAARRSHKFTTAGFSDDATCDNCGIGSLMFENHPIFCHKNFQTELKDLINRYSLDTVGDTPDHILAQYLSSCLEVFSRAVIQREIWYGRGKEAPEGADHDPQS